MLKTLFVLTIAFSLTGAATAKQPTDSKADQAAINKTSEAVRAAFENYALEFLQNDVESLSIHGDIAVEQILFSVKGTPKKGGAPFLVKGRTMLVLIRYDQSPTGWATLREIVQPGPEGE